MASPWGQLLLVGLPGPEFDAWARHLIVELQVGGIILFRRNISSLEQVADLIRQGQEAALAAGGLPLLVAVDQEGGPVQRLRQPFPETPAARTLGQTATPAAVARQAREVAVSLRRLGINVNFAPVLDLAPSPACPLWERSYASDPETVAAYGRAAIQGYLQGGVLPVGKHFPGLGPTTLDSHLDLPRIPGEAASLAANLLPFQEAIAVGVPGLMVAHLVVEAWDDLPASLSPVAISQVLRHQLGFPGLVFSDDLEMGAIRKYWPLTEAAKLGVAAGLDQLLICEHVAEVEAVIAALTASPDLLPQLTQARNRLLQVKKNLHQQNPT